MWKIFYSHWMLFFNCGDRFIISGQKKKKKQTEICIISSLCFTELNGTLTIIIMYISYRKVSPLAKQIFWFYLYSFVRLTYHSTMKLLTIDRLLVFHLNMTYLILWPSERLLKSLKVIYLISQLYFHCFLVFSQANRLGLYFQYYVYRILHLGCHIYYTSYCYILLHFYQRQDTQRTH